MKILSVERVGKAFRDYHSEWHRFARWFGIHSRSAKEQWVLRNINFDIRPGEAIGIVGQNGAGKSTLLKIITGTLQPTEGKVHINGRVAAILELGMGFNPELTGRQNVYHAAGIMGFNLSSINQMIAEIQSFAEIGEYFDEAVRTFSSGMQMRLAFAVATGWRPEILIVDEALSVGDAYFQHKCFERIKEFQRAGTSLLIVSHDRSAIQALCNRAILIEDGSIVRDGDPEDVFDFYNAMTLARNSTSIEVDALRDGKSKVTSGTKEAEFESIKIFDCRGVESDVIAVGERTTVRLEVKVNEDVDSLVFGYGVKDRLGQLMFGTNTLLTGQKIDRPRRGNSYSIEICFAANLGVGSYSIQIALVEGENYVEKNFQWIDRALMFSVVNEDKHDFVGCQWHEMEFSISKSEGNY